MVIIDGEDIDVVVDGVGVGVGVVPLVLETGDDGDGDGEEEGEHGDEDGYGELMFRLTIILESISSLESPESLLSICVNA